MVRVGWGEESLRAIDIQLVMPFIRDLEKRKGQGVSGQEAGGKLLWDQWEVKERVRSGSPSDPKGNVLH